MNVSLGKIDCTINYRRIQKLLLTQQQLQLMLFTIEYGKTRGSMHLTGCCCNPMTDMNVNP